MYLTFCNGLKNVEGCTRSITFIMLSSFASWTKSFSGLEHLLPCLKVIIVGWAWNLIAHTSPPKSSDLRSAGKWKVHPPHLPPDLTCCPHSDHSADVWSAVDVDTEGSQAVLSYQIHCNENRHTPSALIGRCWLKALTSCAFVSMCI